MSMPVRRLLAFALVGVHLILAVAAVPHLDPPAVIGGVTTADHPHRAHPPHRHWVWDGPGHLDHDHSHGSPGGSHARQADAPADTPVDHERDALYLADAFLVTEAGSPGLAALRATGWITVPSPAGPDGGPPKSGPRRDLRPPGACLPAHLALLPHVLHV